MTTGVTLFPADAVSGAPSYTGRMLREAMGVTMAGATSGRPLGGRSGIRPGTGTCVTATSTTWTVTPHAGFLDLEAAVQAGGYFYAINTSASTMTGNVTAADATNSRVDIVYLTLNDPAEGDGTTTPDVVAGYLAGAADGTNTPPSAPARSMVLAQISVPKSGSGSPSVVMVAPITAAAGGVAPCTGATRPANPYAGMPIFETDNQALRVWDGSVWTTASAARVRVGVAASDGAVTNTAWTAHPNSPVTTVKAPPSGKLLITFGGSIFVGGSTSSFGTGTLGVQANGAGLTNVVSSDTASHAAMGQSSANVSNTTIISGLTADQNVTLTLVDQVASGGNAIYFNGRWMMVQAL